MRWILVAVLAAMLLLAACTSGRQLPTPLPIGDSTQQGANTSNQSAQVSLDTIESIGNDLNFTELDTLDKDLNFSSP